jgi:hypothetical protein
MAADPELAVAQAAVTMINPELGPFLSRLPDELLIYIFSIVATTLFPPNSRLLNPEIGINPDTFAILNRHYAIKRIRNVSKTFCAFYMQAFYENLHFVCKKPKTSSYWLSEMQTTRPPMLPPSQMRHFLRTARIEITLENNYQGDYEPYPGNPGRRMRRRHKIQSLEQLMALCPSARVLARLTHPASGFCNLSHLELVVHVDLTGHPLDDEFLSVLEEANFVVKAKKVTLSGTVTLPAKTKDYNPNLFQKVQEKIKVVETG